jgi:hypothetical protein
MDSRSSPKGCQRCHHLCATHEIDGSQSWEANLAIISDALQTGPLKILCGDVWHDAILECTACGQQFDVVVDTERGCHGTWGPANRLPRR